MLAELFRNFKASLKPILQDPTENQATLQLLNVSNVVSFFPNNSRKRSTSYKEGQFTVTKRWNNQLKLSYLTFEWIPLEGYYSRFSKRNLSSDNDMMGTAFRRKKGIRKKEEHIYHPSCFWQIFREHSLWISQIRILWTEWENDLGYVKIQDVDSLTKIFKFLHGGLRNLETVLKSEKYQHYISKKNHRKVVFIINNSFSCHLPSFMLYDRFGNERNCGNWVVDIAAYEGFFNEHGQMEDIFNFKRLAFYFGLNNSIRKEAWKFLLGFHTFSSTPEERFTLCSIAEQNYVELTNERLSLDDTDPLFSIVQKVEGPIEKDVARTDRLNPFYSGASNIHLKSIKNILLNYCYSRPQIGYTQGMTDVLAPILQVFESESHTFWCFIEFIEKMHGAIFPSDDNMDHVTTTLLELIKFLIQHVYVLLKQHDLDVLMIFTHRWFLLCYQREFAADDVMRLWETCWSNQYCSPGYFQFFIAVAIIYCYHEATENGDSIFNSTTDEALIFFSQNKQYDCQAVLRCAQVLLKAFRNATMIPCTLQCFVNCTLWGGWELAATQTLDCKCSNRGDGHCGFRRVSIADNMSELVSRGVSHVDIDTIRTSCVKETNSPKDSVFED